MGNVAVFRQAAESFIALVEQVPPGSWNEHGLGSWSIRSLVGHTARAILTVETYLTHDDPGRAGVASAEDYFALVYPDFADPEAVAARGVEAGIWLGDEQVEKITDALHRACELIADAPLGRVVSVGGHGIELSEYLHTRIFELVTHSLDLARALGRPHGQSAAAVTDATVLAAKIGARTGSGEEILLALTGREALPTRFTVL